MNDILKLQKVLFDIIEYAQSEKNINEALFYGLEELLDEEHIDEGYLERYKGTGLSISKKFYDINGGSISLNIPICTAYEECLDNILIILKNNNVGYIFSGFDEDDDVSDYIKTMIKLNIYLKDNYENT